MNVLLRQNNKFVQLCELKKSSTVKKISHNANFRIHSSVSMSTRVTFFRWNIGLCKVLQATFFFFTLFAIISTNTIFLYHEILYYSISQNFSLYLSSFCSDQTFSCIWFFRIKSFICTFIGLTFDILIKLLSIEIFQNFNICFFQILTSLFYP